jgi:hypothetical protein
MKTTIKISVALIALLVLSTSSFAITADSVFVNPVLGKKKAIISVVNVPTASLSVIIKDVNGAILTRVSEKNSEYFSKVFDFTNLIDGGYSLEVNINNTTKKYDFFVEKNEIILKDKHTIESSPYVGVSNNKLDISHINSEKKPVYLDLIDSNGNLVYNNFVSDDFTVLKRYNLSQLRKGSYTAKVTVGKTEYVSKFELK